MEEDAGGDIDGISLPVASGSTIRGCEICEERHGWHEKNKFQDEMDTLKVFYEESPPQHSFFATIQHMLMPQLLWENAVASSNSMAQTEHAGETGKLTGLGLFLWMNVMVFVMMAQFVLAMIPSFRNNDDNDPVFFALGGTNVFFCVVWALITMMIQQNQGARKGHLLVIIL